MIRDDGEGPFSMRHSDIWRGIDLIAARHSLTASGLAKLAGLDATAFNKSKREAKDGRPRWPSTESISRALDAVGVTFDDFASLVAGRRSISAPLIGLAQAGADGFFDDAGFPRDEGWEEVQFPGIENDDGLYALEISGESMQPAYRPGDKIVVSPLAAIHRGDRVVAKTRGGEVMAKVLGRKNSDMVELLSLNPDHLTREFTVTDIVWMARIIWVSQ
jgi:phage repressor protein C with HTH and peptisase S24 domain